MTEIVNFVMNLRGSVHEKYSSARETPEEYKSVMAGPRQQKQKFWKVRAQASLLFKGAPDDFDTQGQLRTPEYSKHCFLH